MGLGKENRKIKKAEKTIREFAELDDLFFDLDKENKTAKISLHFERPSEIFDRNYDFKIPVLSDDFLDWIGSTFSMVSSKYKLDLTVSFKDMEGYDPDTLEDIFRKNLELELKIRRKKAFQKNKVAFWLIGVGVLFFLVRMLISRFWLDDSVLREIFIYVSDIATTVTFWEAVVILVVDQKERRESMAQLARQFSSIRFSKEEDR